MKAQILILLNIFIFTFSLVGNIADFSDYPELQKIILKYSENYDSKFKTIFKDGPIYSGDGTAYGDSKNGGNCLFPKEEYYSDMMYAALNHDQYMDDMGCGLCAVVVSTSNPYNPIRIRVIDQCPECEHGSLDFSDKAFKALTNMDPARVKITWALIPCDIDILEYPALLEKDSEIKFKFKIGSNQNWFQVQVFNTRYPVSLVEMKINEEFIEMERERYNYWARNEDNEVDVGEGPYTFRVTLADSTMILAEDVEMVVPLDDEDSDFSTGTQSIFSN